MTAAAGVDWLSRRRGEGEWSEVGGAEGGGVHGFAFGQSFLLLARTVVGRKGPVPSAVAGRPTRAVRCVARRLWG